MRQTIKDQICTTLINKHGQEIVTRKQVIQALLDVRGDGEIYDHEKHRGLYSYALSPQLTNYTRRVNAGYMTRPGRSQYCLEIVGRGLYEVRTVR